MPFSLLFPKSLDIDLKLDISKKSVRNIKLEKGKFKLRDEFELIFERTITKSENGAKIDAPKNSLARKVYVTFMLF